MAPGRTLIVIAGPTGVGKTALAIDLAKILNTEIISADSRQFYKDLSIGVARPTDEQLAEIPHHFIGFLPIDAHYSAGQFSRDAEQLLSNLFQSHQFVICVGGSGLFIDALVEGLDDLPSDPKVREEINLLYAAQGLIALQNELRERDPDYFAVIDQNNPHRLVRAIEVCHITGVAYSKLRKREVAERTFETKTFVLEANRELLYDRINHRVDEMLEAGLEEEARKMLPLRQLNSLNTVGYKELFEFFDGRISREEAIEKIKQHTRNYAKRQLTWWRRKEDIIWINTERGLDEMGKEVLCLI
jgi:tRNA dimethylallyltransferase